MKMYKKAFSQVINGNLFFMYVTRCNVYNLSQQRPYPIKNQNKDDEVMPNILQNIQIKSLEDWKSIRQKIIDNTRNISLKNIDATTLHFCINNKKYDLAQSYINFLKNENIQFNLATIGKYFKLFNMLHRDNAFTEEDEKTVLSLYDEVRKKFKILDSITIEHCILGLSVTKYWKKCLDLLNEIKITDVPNSVAYSAIVSAAFANNEDDIAWKLLDEMIENRRIPFNSTYISYLKQIQDKSLANEVTNKLEYLFEFFGYNDIKCDKELCDVISETLNNTGKSFSYTFIAKDGTCKTCKKRLKKLKLTEDEFHCLKEVFFEKVIIGKNVFCKTTPEELRAFKNFTDDMEKFDVVVDGLNVAYSIGTKQSPAVLSMLLANVVQYFKSQGKTVLVLGRKHMTKWPRQNWSYVTQNATTFLTDNLSQDDPYLLYCALHSGLNTIIVSRDLMRSHLYLLKDVKHRRLFSRWLTQCRYQLLHIGGRGNAVFKKPLPYLETAQKDDNFWHIPYYDEDDNLEFKWMCLRL